MGERWEEALLRSKERPLHRGQWHRYQVWSRNVASKILFVAVKSGQSTCRWEELASCEVEPEHRQKQTVHDHTYSSCSFRIFSKKHKPIYKTVNPGTPIYMQAAFQGHGDMVIRVTVLSWPQIKEKQRIFFFICCTTKYNTTWKTSWVLQELIWTRDLLKGLAGTLSLHY